MLLSGAVVLTSYILHNPNNEGSLEEFVSTVLNVFSIIPLSTILLLLDAALLKKVGKTKHARISFLSAVIIALVGIFLVLRYITGGI